MTTKKPDRWERMVGKLLQYGNGSCEPELVSSHDIIKLLRKEHKAVMRMVRNEKVSGETGTEGDIAYNQAIEDILSKLNERAR